MSRWLVVLTLLAGLLSGERVPLSGQANLLAADGVLVSGEDGSESAMYLRTRIGHRRSAFHQTFDLLVSGWLRPDDPSESLVNLEDATIRPVWGPVEFRFGAGDLAWGISETRSPVDVLVSRAWLWDAGRGVRLGQPLVEANLFLPWGDLAVVAFPFTRPVHFGGLPSETWTGATLATRESWGDHAGWGARFARAFGPVDLAISYVDGSDRSPVDAVPEVGAAMLEPPSLEQAGYEVQWATGPFLLYSEGAWGQRGGDGEGRANVGVEWFAAPYLSLVLEQGFATREPGDRIPLARDLIVGSRLIAERLRANVEMAIDPRSGNRHWLASARWLASEVVSLESEWVGWSGDATREPPFALRQRNALRVSLVAYF